MEGNDSKSVSFDGPYIEYHQGTGNTNMGLNDNGNGSIFIHFWAEKRKAMPFGLVTKFMSPRHRLLIAKYFS